MAKSKWEKANIIVIVIGLITALGDGGNTYHILREAQWQPYIADKVALSVVVLHFGIFYGIFCLIRWIAKGYRAKKPIGSKQEQKTISNSAQPDGNC